MCKLDYVNFILLNSLENFYVWTNRPKGRIMGSHLKTVDDLIQVWGIEQCTLKKTMLGDGRKHGIRDSKLSWNTESSELNVHQERHDTI